MMINELRLRNFTVFESADFPFAKGINVAIGENATGKSHLLKVLYALLRAGAARAANPDEELRARLSAIFRSEDVGRLVRRGAEEGAMLVLNADSGETHASITSKSEPGVVEATLSRWPESPRALFLPAREVLAMYEGFIPLYDGSKLSFDETYYDLCVALQHPSLRGEAKSAADELSKPLFKLLKGEVELRDGRFHVDLGDGPTEAHLVAEGLRKIATLAHLAGNGSIAAGSVLFWDEPETNLNPRLITPLAEALRGLASRGVQIVIATHDFLLAHQLSLAAEYKTEPDVETRFFSLHREELTYPVEVEWADTVAGLQNNPILDAYAQYYDHQRDLYQKALERDLEAESR